MCQIIDTTIFIVSPAPLEPFWNKSTGSRYRPGK